MNLFKVNENGKDGLRLPLNDMLKDLVFNDLGLIPVIAQQHDTKEVLMMAWMNLEAIEETIRTGRVCYWSRSRQSLWRKGESSGQVQLLKSLSIDCDGDTLLMGVDQTGPACHTGRRSCFFYKKVDSDVVIDGEVLIDPQTLYKK